MCVCVYVCLIVCGRKSEGAYVRARVCVEPNRVVLYCEYNPTHTENKVNLTSPLFHLPLVIHPILFFVRSFVRVTVEPSLTVKASLSLSLSLSLSRSRSLSRTVVSNRSASLSQCLIRSKLPQTTLLSVDKAISLVRDLGCVRLPCMQMICIGE